MDNQEYYKSIINNAKLMIDRNIHKFLFELLYYIFIKTDGIEKNVEKLKGKINIINKKYIKGKDEYLNMKYENRNLNNIIKFVKKQNSMYAGEIIENILIIIFSFTFETSRDKTFEKYIYNDLQKLADKKKTDELCSWFNKDKLNIIKEKTTLKSLLENDTKDRKHLNNIQEEPIYEILLNIYIEKTRIKNVFKKKIMNYINRRFLNFKVVRDKITKTYNSNKNTNATTQIDYVKSLSDSKIASDLLYEDEKQRDKKIKVEIGKIIKREILLIRSMLISTYIYSKNKKFPLIEYINDEKNISYKYNLFEAGLESKFAGIVLSPIRIEPRMNEIKIGKCSLKENGIMELGKILLFNNKSIKKIDLNFYQLTNSSLIDYLNYILGLFDNNSVEVLNLSYNYLKEDCSEFLANILTHLKNLKSINLAVNDLRRGISSFLIVLKNLYRKGKTNLEKLNLNKCLLDDIAFYELGELLKSKYCKLKYLYLNVNNIPSASNFLKKLKKNKSLVEIYFNENNIDNNDTDCILRIISYTNIECLYLYNNKIHDFSQCLRIIYRTKLIKDRNNKEVLEEKIREDANLFNLDVSHNLCYNKNKNKIELIYNLIDDTTLYCLDFTKIIYDEYPEKFTGNDNYTKSVDKLKNKLENEQNEYNNKIGELLRNEVDKERALRDIKENSFNYIDDKIQEIIENEKANNNIFLRLNAKNLVNNNDEIWNNNINENNGKTKKEIFNDLLNYLKLKRADKNIKEINNKINLKKMILI